MSTVYTAARDGEIAALQTALRQGGADAADRFQCSALYMAARGGHTRAVELLLKSQADPNLANNGGWTPLIVAAARNHHAVIEQLLRAGADASAQTCAYVTATARDLLTPPCVQVRWKDSAAQDQEQRVHSSPQDCDGQAEDSQSDAIVGKDFSLMRSWL